MRRKTQNQIRGANETVGRKNKLFSLFLLSALFFSASDTLSVENNGEIIENTRTALEKWVETQRLISKEQQDLDLSKEMLNERIDLIQREIESLRSKIKEAKGSIAEADKKRDELVKENEKLKEASASIGGTLATLESRGQQLLKRLPEPIQERVKPLSQRLPVNAEETKLSTGERFQNVVGILNEIDKFNRDISVTSEVRTLADGSSVEVTAMYVGIGQGFYASANGKFAGIGTVSEDKWVWNEKNEEAAKILDAIAILKNEKVASFVQMPVDLR